MMANPQKENGYTAISNGIMDALIAVDLSGQDFRIALLIIRKTYGFNKIEDAVSLSQMMAATGLCKVRCSQVVNRLQLMKILTVTENINGIGKKYKFNKDFEKWSTVKENINRYKKTKSTVNVLINPPLMKTVTTKDTITKDNIQKTRTPRKAKAVLTPLPENFTISERVRSWAAKKKQSSLDQHLENFILVCTAKGYQYADWDSAFMNAIRSNWAKIGERSTASGYRAQLSNGERDVREYKPEELPNISEAERIKNLEKIRAFSQKIG